ncbi:MAG: NAD(P)/FAD-dependent oxidoreductase [Thermoplasmata archaeon]
MESADVLVVGAGPAGSTAAYELARRGHDVLVVEEHGTVGRPVQCAGLVSDRALTLAGSRASVRRPVHGAGVFGPSRRGIEFRAETPRAYAIDRAGLDRELAERAVRAGARLRAGVAFRGRTGSDGGGRERVLLRGPSGSLEEAAVRLVIGADGVASGVARAYRLRRPVEILPAFEAEYAESPGDPDRVEVYLSQRFAPGLFGWWIPDGAGGARIGLAAHADGTSARRYFERLAGYLAERFGRPLGTPTGYLASGIPIGNVPRTCTDRVLLVGDAAAQVKPLSGGGIFTGMRCAQIGAEVADVALRTGDLSAGALAAYDRRWREEFGEEFSRALALRRIFVRLSDAELDRLIDTLRDSRLIGTIVAFGDIDFPSHVARRLLAESPSLVRLLPKALSAWIGGDRDYRAPALDPPLETRRK